MGRKRPDNLVLDEHRRLARQRIGLKAKAQFALHKLSGVNAFSDEWDILARSFIKAKRRWEKSEMLAKKLREAGE